MHRFLIGVLLLAAGACTGADLWQLAAGKRQIHQFSIVFAAQDVRDLLADDAGIAAAVDWCRKSGVTKVYLETFRNGYQADRAVLQKARDGLRAAAIEAAGAVTTTGVWKPSTGWQALSCYTDRETQRRVRSIFEFAAGIFDEIALNDFWFTDCTCQLCDSARRLQSVNILGNSYPVSGQSWEQYRSELMYELARENVLGAARQVNRKARVYLKFPDWYDRMHDTGVDVLRNTSEFDKVWASAGSGSRDRGATPYRTYFLMRWLGGIAAKKFGGAWLDVFNTDERTFVEQERQTILGGGRESVLCCYGGLSRGSGPAAVAALRENMPELLSVAEQLRRRRAVGIAAYKPAASPGQGEPYIFDFVGELGLPLDPTSDFPEEAASGFFSFYGLSGPDFVTKASLFMASGRRTLLTDSVAAQLDPGMVKANNVRILPVNGNPKSVLRLTAQELDPLRSLLLEPLRRSFRGPSQLGLYLFADGSYVVENFSDQEAAAELDGAALKIPARGWIIRLK